MATNDQDPANGMLLSLPAELRIKIYAYVQARDRPISCSKIESRRAAFRNIRALRLTCKASNEDIGKAERAMFLQQNTFHFYDCRKLGSFARSSQRATEAARSAGYGRKTDEEPTTLELLRSILISHTCMLQTQPLGQSRVVMDSNSLKTVSCEGCDCIIPNLEYLTLGTCLLAGIPGSAPKIPWLSNPVATRDARYKDAMQQVFAALPPLPEGLVLEVQDRMPDAYCERGNEPNPSIYCCISLVYRYLGNARWRHLKTVEMGLQKQARGPESIWGAYELPWKFCNSHEVD
ncbi:hypothetical protein LTR62_005593 [Meristemomyces frigidus]|uniref:Uncharacterized protein n=1 Tax=Meristemomyces frigidus TaxID=1508187 RepID=A0AAN7TGR0_9PEZI|nr:hypothetical protein LTR62_005593 [Meristemomyces frigidus]